MDRKLSWRAHLYVVAVLLFLYLPIITIVIYSFNANPTASSAEFTGFTTQWYEAFLHDHEIAKTLRTSLIVGTRAVLVSLAVGIPAALVLARTTFPTRQFFDSVTLLPLLLPEIVLGIAFMSFYSLVGIPFGTVSLVISHATFIIPYVIILVTTRLVGFDESLREASRDLGAGPVRTFLEIVLPQIAPAIVSSAALGFVLSFDDVVISFFTAGASSSTLPLLIYSQVKLHPQPTTKALCSLIIIVALFAVAVLFALKAFADKRAEKRLAAALS